MLATSTVVTFILTNDAERAKVFYGETLGLKFLEEEEHTVAFAAHGAVLRLVKMKGHVPSEHPSMGWDVADLVATAAELVAAGVTFEKYSFLEQDENGVWTAPNGTTKLAWFKDPDGNVLGLSQH